MARRLYRALCNGEVIAGRLERAASPLLRMRGLLGRRSLEEGEGIWLEPASSIHTHFMRFPIDVLFLGSRGRVLKKVPALPPWRCAGARGAHSVLELRAGTFDRVQVDLGDRVVLEPVECGA
jgi:uncharacterized protein